MHGRSVPDGRTDRERTDPVGHLDRPSRHLGRLGAGVAALEAGAGQHVHRPLALVDVLLAVGRVDTVSLLQLCRATIGICKRNGRGVHENDSIAHAYLAVVVPAHVAARVVLLEQRLLCVCVCSGTVSSGPRQGTVSEADTRCDTGEVKYPRLAWVWTSSLSFSLSLSLSMLRTLGAVCSARTHLQPRLQVGVGAVRAAGPDRVVPADPEVVGLR